MSRVLASEMPAAGAVPAADATADARPDALDKTMLAVTVAVWAGNLLMVAVLLFLVSRQPADPSVLAVYAMGSGAGIVLCMGVYLLIRRSGEVRPWSLLLKVVALSLPMSVILAFFCQTVGHLTSFYQYYPENWLDPYSVVWTSLDHLWILLTWSALFVGATAVFEVRQRDLQLAAMRDAAQQAELHALRSQINPHFLFNTLNTLAGLISLDRSSESERMVLNLSRFLRHTLSHPPSRLVPLAAETDILRMYLEIETARFGERLSVRYDVPAECRRALVPGLVLLPLAENSIKYALAGAEEGIEIRVGARREGDSLALWLEDSGTARANGGGGLGIGLTNTRQQLAALFGDDGSLESGPAPGGWRNFLRIPWQEAAR